MAEQYLKRFNLLQTNEVKRIKEEGHLASELLAQNLRESLQSNTWSERVPVEVKTWLTDNKDHILRVTNPEVVDSVTSEDKLQSIYVKPSTGNAPIYI